MKESKKMDIFTCDACNQKYYVDPKIDMRPPGMYGSLQLGSCGETYTFYSCEENNTIHIMKAMVNARQRQDREGSNPDG